MPYLHLDRHALRDDARHFQAGEFHCETRGAGAEAAGQSRTPKASVVALGARNAGLERKLLGRILLPVRVGVALGFGGAAASSRLIESLLFGVTALDPGTYALAAFLLIALACRISLFR